MTSRQYQTVPQVYPERVLSSDELNLTRQILQVGGEPISCQRHPEEFRVPPCAGCGKSLFFLMSVSPHDVGACRERGHPVFPGRDLSWGDCGDYLVFVCPDCFAGGKPGTFHITGDSH